MTFEELANMLENGEISVEKYVDEYNKLIEIESNKSMETDPLRNQREFT